MINDVAVRSRCCWFQRSSPSPFCARTCAQSRRTCAPFHSHLRLQPLHSPHPPHLHLDSHLDSTRLSPVLPGTKRMEVNHSRSEPCCLRSDAGKDSTIAMEGEEMVVDVDSIGIDIGLVLAVKDQVPALVSSRSPMLRPRPRLLLALRHPNRLLLEDTSKRSGSTLPTRPRATPQIRLPLLETLSSYNFIDHCSSTRSSCHTIKFHP